MIYPGGKNGAGVYQAIINQMPPHAVFIEPFLGSGAILRLKRPAAVNVGIDLDPRAVETALAMFGDSSGTLTGSDAGYRRIASLPEAGEGRSMHEESGEDTRSSRPQGGERSEPRLIESSSAGVR